MSKKKVTKRPARKPIGKAAPKKSAATKPAAKSLAKPGSPMDLNLLEQLGKLMSDNDLSLLNLRDGEQRIYLRRGQITQTAPVAAPAPTAAPPAPAPVAPAASTPPPAPAEAADDTAGLTPIKSPMVGTFYAAPNPDAKDFVTVGSKVTSDTDVCIIEAMKVFNNIKAETTGEIAKILVKAGDSVEYGQTLFLVKA
ncbi:MAG: acetyl-CoA carboxylase biotin carboxyl carrier protein [Planctomycetota bacterium]